MDWQIVASAKPFRSLVPTTIVLCNLAFEILISNLVDALRPSSEDYCQLPKDLDFASRLNSKLVAIATKHEHIFTNLTLLWK